MTHMPTRSLSRRELLKRMGYGAGSLAVGSLLGGFGSNAVWADDAPLAARIPPLPAKAKSVIHLFAGGAPSHIDTFDPKPALEKYRDRSLPGQSGVAFPSPFAFHKRGKSGLEISEVFPKLGEVADHLCVIRSLFTDVPAHGPAAKFVHTGSPILTKPSLGSWVLYGLGSGNRALPGFVTLGGNVEWRQAAFLPSPFQGTRADFAPRRPVDKVLLNLRNDFSSSNQQRQQIDLLHQLDALHMEQVQRDEQLEARVESFELAYSMETAATEAFDTSKEPKEMQALYGQSDIGQRLLCARRLVERGVRFVQIDVGGWDHHTDVSKVLLKAASNIDGPAAALISDLKQRGLLDSTLVMWGGEFGRTATTAGRVNELSGRDHHAKCFSMWMAGGGTKGGMAYGASDELGIDVAEKGVHIHDLHATVMRLLGFDHTKLTFRYNGRDFRLTDNFGTVITDIIA